jgi:hypothetical protein
MSTPVKLIVSLKLCRYDYYMETLTRMISIVNQGLKEMAMEQRSTNGFPRLFIVHAF